MYRSVQSSTDSVHSVKPCSSGNLSVGSVTLYKSVWCCIGKGWFADVVVPKKAKKNRPDQTLKH